MNEKVINQYCKEALKKCPLAYRKKLQSDLYNSVCDYAEANSCADMDEIIQRFGKPEQVLDSYIESLDSQEKQEIFKSSKFVKRAVAISVAIIILLTAVAATWVILENHFTKATYYKEEIYE